MILNRKFILEGASQQNLQLDLSYSESQEQGLIIFCHGFKGFKDWGCWQLVADYFVDNGFAFLKFNFSHNGMGLEDSVNSEHSINSLPILLERILMWRAVYS
jgi:alpha/beta superfamily hydrolase